MSVGSRSTLALWLASMAGVVLALVCVGSVVVRANRFETRRLTESERRDVSPKPSVEGGYISSDACRACHPGEYDSWHRTYHRTMTQVANAQTVKGDFDDVSLEYFGRKFQLQQRGDEFWIKQDGGTEAKVLQTTGSHHYQVYWVGSGKGNLLHNFPFVYLLEDQRWARRNDVFMMPPHVGERPEAVNPWNDGCIACHATFGQSKVNASTQRADTEVAELGIACEACHGPAQEHVEYYQNPANRYAAHFSEKPAHAITNPESCDPKKSTQICGQCHGVSRELDREAWRSRGFLYRPGDELEDTRIVARHPRKVTQDWHRSSAPDFFDKYFWRDGMIRVSGREYNGLLETACYQRGEMSCLSCHSMHDADPSDQLKQEMDSNTACLQCHQSIGEDIAAHTHHQVDSAGSLCFNCHMPHTTFGLLKAIRSHQIDSPSVASQLQSGRPQACNLCHLDKTLAWTAEQLHDWYDHPVPPLSDKQQSVSAAVLDVLSGDAGQRAIASWHMGWEPALETSGRDWIAPFLLERLSDPYPAVRYNAIRSLRKLPGFNSFEFDFSTPADADIWRAGREVWKRAYSTAGRKRPANGPLLFDEVGTLQDAQIRVLSAERDDRPVDLLE